MKSYLSKEEVHALYMEHLEGCDQCNYDKDCMLCAGGFGTAEDELVGIQKVTSHSCNCPHGNGIGRRLYEMDRHFRLAEELTKAAKGINEIQGSLTMLGILLKHDDVET